jgi:hypothetical protein
MKKVQAKVTVDKNGIVIEQCIVDAMVTLFREDVYEAVMLEHYDEGMHETIDKALITLVMWNTNMDFKEYKKLAMLCKENDTPHFMLFVAVEIVDCCFEHYSVFKQNSNLFYPALWIGVLLTKHAACIGATLMAHILGDMRVHDHPAEVN